MLKNFEDLFDDFAEEFLNEVTSRIIIIVGSSKIDESLANIITKGLLPKLSKQNDQDELLEGDNPLATFSSRIKIAYRFGIIDFSFYTVLEKIRKIRNIGAHQLEFNISASPLKDHVADLIKLVSQRKSFKLTKERYFDDNLNTSIDELKCAILSVCVLLQAINAKVREPKIRQSFYRITKN